MENLLTPQMRGAIGLRLFPPGCCKDNTIHGVGTDFLLQGWGGRSCIRPLLLYKKITPRL